MTTKTMVLWASCSVVPNYPRILRRGFVDDDVGRVEWREGFNDSCTSEVISELKERLSAMSLTFSASQSFSPPLDPTTEKASPKGICIAHEAGMTAPFRSLRMPGVFLDDVTRQDSVDGCLPLLYDGVVAKHL
jgi:hypothetical protein